MEIVEKTLPTHIVDAVKREIFEESGIEVEVGEVFCISSNTCTYPDKVV